MKEYHYVVSFNTTTKEWVHEYDVESIKFDGKTVWNHKIDDWESTYEGDEVWDDSIDEIDEILYDGLAFLNRISAVKDIKKDKNGN